LHVVLSDRNTSLSNFLMNNQYAIAKWMCCLLVTISISTHSFSQVYNFVHYSADEGFSDSKINALWQDRRGNLWIGTSGEGLARFDSHNFYWYRQEDGLLNGFINAIGEDTLGNLWVGTDAGVFLYDGKKFRHYAPLSQEKVNAITRDSSGNMWIGTATHGVYKCNIKSSVPLKSTLKNGIDSKINFLFFDHNAALWIGTSQGLIRYHREEFTLYTSGQGLPTGQVNNVNADASGNLWFATENGLFSFTNEKFVFSEFNNLKGENFNNLVFDNKNNIWLGSDDGILKFDGRHLRRYDDPSKGQKKIAILCSYKDGAGNLWFGTSEGLSKLDSERFTHYQDNDRMGKRVYSIVQAINGNIICGTSLGGTTVFDGEQYTLLNQREGLTSSIVQCFYYTADSSLWIGTLDDGVYKFAKSGMQHYSADDALPVSNITGFTEDRDHNLWIASADSGVSVVRTTNDSIHVIRRYSTRQGMASNKINAIATDGTFIWIGTDEGTLKIPTDKPETVTPLNVDRGNTVHAILADSTGRVYVATSQGVYLYEGNRSRHLTRNDGLSSNIIYSLTIDRQRNLWAGTERGVDRITLTDLASVVTIRHFGMQEGFRGGEVYRNSSCVDRKGNVWFGTINGLVKYDPGEDIVSDALPSVYLTGIKLFFDPIEDTPYGDSLAPWYPLPAHLNLPHNQNNLTFSFTGVYHRKPHAVKYKWILEGFNQGWSPALTEPQATFSNLPPGTYTFKVIASNENNVWTTTPASYTFSIALPFWQRWWFVVAVVLVVVGTISMIFYTRLQRFKTKNKIIQERLEMEKSILQLEQEAARLQMNPHFIFNCLNSIQGFIAANDPFQAKKYLAKFAKLMRLILENAREEFIPLENEITILESYLELEKLSIQPAFEFSITLDSSIDYSRIQIPPMMIQPFVENAIVHGLRKKETSGMIAIHFTIQGALLTCTITDNGIGRERAAELNRRSIGQHTSSAIPITEKRLEQYGAYLKVKAGVSIIDLKEDGVATGTQVVMSTPFETY